MVLALICSILIFVKFCPSPINWLAITLPNISISPLANEYIERGVPKFVILSDIILLCFLIKIN